MPYQRYLRWMIPAIALLALFAAGMGLFYQTEGAPYPFQSLRGERVMIEGRGLYAFDSVSGAAQERGNDLISLVVGVPLLLISAWYAFRSSLRGRLLLTGTIGFFLYTYLSMSMLTAYNHLFLVYVALFILSLYAFILSMLSYDLSTLPGRFAANTPRGWIAALLFVVAAFLLLAWLGRILAPLAQGAYPPLENTTTLVIQALDLSLLAPAAILGGVLLLKGQAWGYLLSSVLVLKSITMGLAVSTMAISMALSGTPESLGIMVPFMVITLANLVAAVVLLKSVDG